MILFPAIDIKNGQVVRLLQGEFDKVTKYSGTPLDAARQWQDKGAQWLHVVDLDGAQTGELKNSDIVIDIAKNSSIPVQTGGGIRKEADIAKLIEGGVARVVLGTKAIQDRGFLKSIIARYKEKIAVSLDCKNGMLTQRGWVETTDIKATDFVMELAQLGLKCLVYTDVARDGMMTGPNFAALEELLAVTNIPVIASGGIANIEDVRKLKTLEPKGIVGAITGKAIYEGMLDLKEALKIC